MLRHIKIILTILIIAGFAVPEVPAISAETAHVHKEGTVMYRCPMHPQIVSDKPGDCPICHMRLVPFTPSSSESTASASLDGRVAVGIDGASRDLIGITTEEVQKRKLKRSVEAWGVVAHDPELYQLQIEFLREERLNYERDRDRTTYAQKRSLTGREKIAIEFLEQGLSQEWINALETAGVPDKRLIFHHETTGVWIYVELRENDAPLVKVGDAVEVTLTAKPELILNGHIQFIDNMVDREARTVRAHVLIESAPVEFMPNSAVSAKLIINLGEHLAISETAPLFTGTRALVFVDEKGVFKPREVILGQHAGGFYEVKEGLMETEKVAKSGNFFIDSESRLRGTLESVTHEGHAS